MQIAQSLLERIKNALLPIFFLGIIIALLVVAKDVLNKPMTWFIISLIVFLVCCGGIVHNILHNAPLYGRHKNDKGEIEYEYISTGNREQYAIEGYIASFISCAFFFNF